MPGTHDHRVAPDELASLLLAWGLDVGPDSTLMSVAEPAAAVSPDELGRRGLLSEEWGGALRALTHPAAVLRVLHAFPERVVVRALYTDGVYPDLVGCWPEGDTFRIGFPYTAVGEVRDASAFLMADFPAQIDPLRVDLTIDGLACLGAAVDTLRAGVLESIVTRRGLSDPVLTWTDLESAHESGLTNADGRWLVTVFHMLMPMSASLPEKLPRDGLEELRRHGLIVPDEDVWRALAPLTQFAGWLLNPLPAIAHEVVVLRDRATHAYRYLIALRGAGPVWTIEFWKDDPPTVTLRSRTGSGYRRLLASILAPLEEAEPSKEAPAVTPPSHGAHGNVGDETAAPSVCPQCGGTTRAGAAFCTACGSSLRE